MFASHCVHTNVIFFAFYDSKQDNYLFPETFKGCSERLDGLKTDECTTAAEEDGPLTRRTQFVTNTNIMPSKESSLENKIDLIITKVSSLENKLDMLSRENRFLKNLIEATPKIGKKIPPATTIEELKLLTESATIVSFKFIISH